MKPAFSSTLIVLVLLCSLPAFVKAVPVAFPGAEGSGRFAAGGRGGDVYEVTNLTNSGPGSIVDAVSLGNRTIVFRVSGTIELGDVILHPKSNTTIAGQTAPGDGICLKGRIYIGSVSDVVIRYIRIRVDEGGANSNGDAIDIASGNNIIIDHVSASYARDETISCQDGSDNITVQWCIMSEALTFEGHSYGSLIRGEYGEEKTYHHNLYAHNNGRNPRPGNYTSTSSDPDGLYFDFRNNVMYNWDGSQPGYNADNDTTSRYNFVGNVCIAGPESNVTGWAFQESAVDAYAYWSGNAYGANYASVSVPSDQWSLVRFSGFDSSQINAYKARSYEVPMEPVTTTSAILALEDVLNMAGASYPVRDIIDTRIVDDVMNGTGSSIATTDDQPEGGWPTLNSLPAPSDSDHDGMPDAWEIANGLNLSIAADRNDYDLDANYTNLEVYLNSLVDMGSGDTTPPAGPTGLSTEIGDSTIGLDWDDNAEGDLSGYYVYRSTTSGSDYDTISTILADSNYIDETAENGITYFYVVTAVDATWNESDYSDEVFATPVDMDFYRDTNDSQTIDMADLFAFLQLWLESDCLITTGWDINNDCRINIDEYSLLAENWLAEQVQILNITRYADVSCRTSLNNGTESEADINKSEINKLSVRGDSKAAKSWIKFDISDLNPAAITQAYLRITLYEPKTSTCLLSAVNDDCIDNIGWGQTDITWNNAPGNYTSSDGVNPDETSITAAELQDILDPAKTTLIETVDYSYGGLAGDQFFFDVLSVLQADTDGIVQFVLHGAGGYTNFTTHDSSLGSDYWPALVITYVD